MHALVIDGTITDSGNLPPSARRLDTGDWVMGLDTAPPDLLAATGWHEVVDAPPPADTATTTHDRSVELVDGTPAVVWTERPKTAEEQTADTKQANGATLRQQARDSLTTLRTSIDTLKAITDKTNANIGPADTKAVARETRRVARQVLALTRLLIGALDSADTGTD